MLLGFVLVVIGLIGMILPVIHGTIFFLIGIIIISFESTYIERKLLQAVHKNEKLTQWHKKLDSFLRKFFRKL